MLYHSQTVVVQVELSKPGEASEYTRSNRCKLVITKVQLLDVVKMLQTDEEKGEGRETKSILYCQSSLKQSVA